MRYSTFLKYLSVIKIPEPDLNLNLLFFPLIWLALYPLYFAQLFMPTTENKDDLTKACSA